MKIRAYWAMCFMLRSRLLATDLASYVLANTVSVMHLYFKLLCIGWFLSLAPVVSAQLAFSATLVEKKALVDDDVVVVEFPFVNSGDKSVTVTELQSSCGCTVAELEKKQYAPGEKGKVTAKFTVGDRHGLQTKEIIVLTDAGKQVLRLAVTVPERVTILPRLLIFRGGEKQAKVISLKFESEVPVELLGIDVVPDIVTVAVETIKTGLEYRLSVTPSGGQSGHDRVTLTIRSRVKADKEYRDMAYVRFVR